MTSPLNSNILLEAGFGAGQAARATEQRKHEENDAKCKPLGWVCVPMVVEAYGAWGTEAMESFSLLASRLATSSNRAKADCLPKKGQATVGVLSPYPECDWNQGYHLVSPHLDAGQGKVVRPG